VKTFDDATITADEDPWQHFGGASTKKESVTAAAAHKPAFGRNHAVGKGGASKGIAPRSPDLPAIQRFGSKTAAQLRELSTDLLSDLKVLRGKLWSREEAVRTAELTKQAKYAELCEKSAGSAFHWIMLKKEAQFPEFWDADIEQAQDEAQDAQVRVNEMEAKLLAVHEMIEKHREGSAASGGDATTLFIHFIPPPLRTHGKSHLPWIVHTCDGSGCFEARHVCINSVTGFSTFEGAPPEQAEGRACRCHIANHVRTP